MRLTGWPVEGSPRSVTIAADTCTQAGTLATLAMLNGIAAEVFLNEQDVRYWCLRSLRGAITAKRSDRLLPTFTLGAVKLFYLKKSV